MDDAVATLKKAIDLRGPDSPPIEELLLALAYQSKSQLEESRRWGSLATAWMDRNRLARQSISAIAAASGGVGACIPWFAAAPVDSLESSYSWETSRMLRELNTEFRVGLKK